MADETVRLRIMHDVIVPRSKVPTEHQQQELARRAHNFMHQVGITEILTEDDTKESSVSPLFVTHIHTGNVGCGYCYDMHEDGLS